MSPAGNKKAESSERVAKNNDNNVFHSEAGDLFSDVSFFSAPRLHFYFVDMINDTRTA